LLIFLTQKKDFYKTLPARSEPSVKFGRTRKFVRLISTLSPVFSGKAIVSGFGSGHGNRLTIFVFEPDGQTFIRADKLRFLDCAVD
jgi:hypothetical protein